MLDVGLVLTLCQRLPLAARILAHRDRGRGSYVIADEYDVQDLLHGVIRAYLKYSVHEEPLGKVAADRKDRIASSSQKSAPRHLGFATDRFFREDMNEAPLQSFVPPGPHRRGAQIGIALTFSRAPNTRPLRRSCRPWIIGRYLLRPPTPPLSTMAHHVLGQLADSRGLGRVVVFTGLSHPVLLHPIVHGEPLLTAQPFYYLDHLEAVAHIVYGDAHSPLPESDLEYLIDNYLFAFSIIHPSSRISARVSSPRFWEQDRQSLYVLADERDTETLALDRANDPSIRDLGLVSPNDELDLSGWDIGRYSAQPSLEAHIAALRRLLHSKVAVTILPTDERDGYVGRLGVVKPGDGLLDYFQAQELENLSINNIPADSDVVYLGRSGGSDRAAISIERITATRQYEPVLLSHFFSGMKELNPMKAFAGYYNVLEFYFEEASSLLGVAARNERDQLECVIRLVMVDADLRTFIHGIYSDTLPALLAPLPTSSGISLDPIAATVGEIDCARAARWLYDIRCAIIHSKKTRHGRSVPSFEPYSDQATNVRACLPLIRHLAVLLMDKDYSLRHPS